MCAGRSAREGGQVCEGEGECVREGSGRADSLDIKSDHIITQVW